MSEEEDVSAMISQQSFGLSTLLLVMTGFAIWLFLVILSPSLGVFLLFFIVPAVARTISAVNARKRQGTTTPIGKKINLFLNSAIFCFGGVLLFFVLCGLSLSILIPVIEFSDFFIPSSGILGMLKGMIYLVIVLASFFFPLFPTIRLLGRDWPREYDPVEDRFLTRREVEERDRVQQAAAESRRNSPDRPHPDKTAQRFT